MINKYLIYLFVNQHNKYLKAEQQSALTLRIAKLLKILVVT